MLWSIKIGVPSPKALKIVNQNNFKFVIFSLPLCPCRAVCTVFSTWLSEYPEDFKSLGEPSRLLRLAPLLPQDSSSAADLRTRLLRIAEELSEKALLPDARKGLYFNWDLNDTVKASVDEVSCRNVLVLSL